MGVFWVVAPCGLIEGYQRFRGTSCLCHQGDETTWCSNPEDRHLHIQDHESLKSHMLLCHENKKISSRFLTHVKDLRYTTTWTEQKPGSLQKAGACSGESIASEVRGPVTHISQMSKPPFQEVKKRTASIPRAKDETASTPRRQPRRQPPRQDSATDSDEEPTLAQQVQDLRAELLAAIDALRADMRPAPGPSTSQHSPEGDRTQRAQSHEEDVLHWSVLADDLPQAPELSPAAAAKLYLLAKEVKRLASLMTTGRDLHDIHTVLHSLAQWPQLKRPPSATRHTSSSSYI
jgi:hypothetical protein